MNPTQLHERLQTALDYDHTRTAGLLDRVGALAPDTTSLTHDGWLELWHVCVGRATFLTLAERDAFNAVLSGPWERGRA